MSRGKITLREESVCGRNFWGFCVFAANPQKFLPQKVHNQSTAKVFSAKFTKKINFLSKLPTAKVFSAKT